MPFNFLFSVQCVNAKAMSWLSMVEYRDLCKLFFKLKIKKIDITQMQVLSGDEVHMLSHTQTHICIHSFDFHSGSPFRVGIVHP